MRCLVTLAMCAISGTTFASDRENGLVVHVDANVATERHVLEEIVRRQLPGAELVICEPDRGKAQAGVARLVYEPGFSLNAGRKQPMRKGFDSGPMERGLIPLRLLRTGKRDEGRPLSLQRS